MKYHTQMALVALAFAATSATAHAAQTASCTEYIASMPREPYDPPDSSGDDDDHTYAWYEPSNDNVVTIIDGRKIKGAQELVDRLYATDSTLHVIAYADFTGWDFRELEAPLTGLCFFRSKLAGSRWDGRDLSRGAFVESDLSGASFKEATLEQALIRDSRLVLTDMTGADLRRGRLDGGWFVDLAGIVEGSDPSSSLNGWKLRGARLDEFSFDCGIEIHNGCPLGRSIDFSEASLRAADLSHFPGWGQFDLAGAVLDGTRLSIRQLPLYSKAEFSGPLVLVGRKLTSEVSALEARELIDMFAASEALREGPSFDCRLADQPVERMICSAEGKQAGLPLLDQHLSQAYAQARQQDPRTADVQKAWLRLRAQCKTYQCLVSTYQRRLSALLGAAGAPAWLTPGESALFVEAGLAVERQFHDRPILRKVAPVIADSAAQTIVLTRKDKDTLSAFGRAIGANAHTCYLGVGGLRIDPRTGWFSSWWHPERTVPVIRIIGDELTVIEDGRPDREVYPDADFVTCGARASFETAAYLPANRSVIEAILTDDAF